MKDILVISDNNIVVIKNPSKKVLIKFNGYIVDITVKDKNNIYTTYSGKLVVYKDNISFTVDKNAFEFDNENNIIQSLKINDIYYLPRTYFDNTVRIFKNVLISINSFEKNTNTIIDYLNDDWEIVEKIQIDENEYYNSKISIILSTYKYFEYEDEYEFFKLHRKFKTDDDYKKDILNNKKNIDKYLKKFKKEQLDIKLETDKKIEVQSEPNLKTDEKIDSEDIESIKNNSQWKLINVFK